MSQSNLKHLEKIREEIRQHPELTEDEKSNSIKHIEEWYRED